MFLSVPLAVVVARHERARATVVGACDFLVPVSYPHEAPPSASYRLGNWAARRLMVLDLADQNLM